MNQSLQVLAVVIGNTNVEYRGSGGDTYIKDAFYNVPKCVRVRLPVP